MMNTLPRTYWVFLSVIILMTLSQGHAIRIVPPLVPLGDASFSSRRHETRLNRRRGRSHSSRAEYESATASISSLSQESAESATTTSSDLATCELVSTRTKRKKQISDNENNPQNNNQKKKQQQQQFIKKDTLISGITKQFQQGVLIRGGQDLHTARLLKACKHLEKVMRSVGQRANANELALNIQKVETVYRVTPKAQRETVSQLLQYERDIGNIHKPGGQLRDPSAAVGLLWLRRSLEFQQKLYAYVIVPPKSHHLHLSSQKPQPSQSNPSQNPQKKMEFDKSTIDSTAAALLAYRKTLEKHHGWKIQRIYTLALRTNTPSRSEMIRTLCGLHPKATTTSSSHRSSNTNKPAATPIMMEMELTPQQERILERDMRQLLSVWKPIISRWKHIFVTLDLEDKRRV
mmetsp:Transcript_13480/g.27912  ORF Transcript_13480/g.27912 Transcript_13480/m.27912 type:complete len:405 (+) Transcript_13480:228-1442(+)